MAEWIVEGEPSLDIYAFRSTRFGSYYANPYYAVERTRECVKYYYRLKFPHDENEWARPFRTSPLHFRLQEYGAVFGEKYGWERVNYFQPGKPWRTAGTDQRAWGWTKPPFFERLRVEHEATRERVAMYDLTSFGKIDVYGPGALDLLQRVADNDVDKPVGSAVYTQFLNSRGGVEADLTITRLGEDYFRVITGSGFISNDLGWIKMHIAENDLQVDVRDVTFDWSCIALWGPKARHVLQKVTQNDVSNQAIPYLNSAWIEVNGTRILAQRVSYVGELGWELYIPSDRALPVWDLLYAAGQEFGLEVGGYKVLELTSVGEGVPLFHCRCHADGKPLRSRLGILRPNGQRRFHRSRCSVKSEGGRR